METKYLNFEEELLKNNEAFILRSASFVVGRPVSRSDDEYSVALSAFWEAARTHDSSKGSLQTYASVVIRHRLIDYIRNRNRYAREISVEPDVFSGEKTENSGYDELQKSIGRKLIYEDIPDNVLAEEISRLAAVLQYYRIDFFDLPNCCPKARKTRSVCLKAARFVCAIIQLLMHLRQTRKLPAAEMETGVPIARKLLDKFRKYIITSVEIEAGDFPGIREYFSGKELP
jgi:RNA polymerase sigma factor